MLNRKPDCRRLAVVPAARATRITGTLAMNMARMAGRKIATAVSAVTSRPPASER